VPGAGIEPARHYVPRDFKSLASTYSATRASKLPHILYANFRSISSKKGARGSGFRGSTFRVNLFHYDPLISFFSIKLAAGDQRRR
jgi:hypothetical protein